MIINFLFLRKKKKILFLLFSLFLLILTTLFPKSVSATSISSILYSNDFNSSSLPTDWTFSGSWDAVNNYLQTNQTGDRILSSAFFNNGYSWKNYSIKIRIQAEKGIDQHVAFRVKDDTNYYFFAFRYEGWPTPKSNNIYACVKANNVQNCNFPSSPYQFPIDKPPYNLVHNQWYDVKIEVQDYKIKLYVDNTKIFDFEDQNKSHKQGTIGLLGWTGEAMEVKLNFDDLEVSDLSEKSPVLLLPGHGGSWNLGTMITDTAVGPWKKTPFVKVYDNFKNTFLNNDYEEGKNYFEFYYDWRKKIDELADDLKNYIDNVVLADKPPDTKIKIVGHSLGGLVARTYLQKYGIDRVDKLVTIGSPHEGVLKAYLAWEGGVAEEKFDWEFLAFELMLHIQKNKFQTNIQAVRSIAPSTKDLLPVFDYLKESLGGNIINVNTMNQQNAWLQLQKSSLGSNTKNIMSTIYGLEDNPSNNTVEYYKVAPRSWLDKLIGQWQDGKPIQYEYTEDGDLTVLTKSAKINDAISTPNVIGTHSKIMESENGLQTILAELGLSDLILSTSSISPPRNPSLLFFLHSPAVMKIITPEGEVGEGVTSPIEKAVYSSEDNLIVIPEAILGNYEIILRGTGSGNYHLEIGQLTENINKWKTLEGNINIDETRTFTINFDPNSPKENPLIDIDGRTLLEMAKTKLENLSEYFNKNLSSFYFKKAVEFSLRQTIKQIDKAIFSVEKNNFMTASNHCQSALIKTSGIRKLLNTYNRSGKIGEEHFTYEEDQLKEVLNLLADAWPILYKNSGKNMKSHLVKNQISFAQRLLNLITPKIEKKAKEGENVILGMRYLLTSQKLEKAEEYFSQNNLEEAYINAFLSRLYSLEVYHLLR